MSFFALQARRRTIFILGSFVLLSLALLGRLVDLQILRHDTLTARAQERLLVKIPLYPWRGHIFDSRGRPLALNEQGYVLWMDGRRLEINDSGARRLLNEISRFDDAYTDLFLNGDVEQFILWTRWLTPAQRDAIEEYIESTTESGDDMLAGVYLETEPRRVYPYGEMLSPVLGFLRDLGVHDARQATGNVAMTGVEQWHDRTLRGVSGWVSMEQDKNSGRIPIGPYEELPPEQGGNITLTLDLTIQYQAYRLLTEAIGEWDARRGDIVVLQPDTGAILAMVSYPSFDPNNIDACMEDWECNELLYTFPNAAIGRHYEPGSTMKILSMAIALEEHVIRPDSTFECNGEIWVGDQRYRNYDGQAHGHESMDEILLHSCNVGAIHITQLVGPEDYYQRLQRLGFGQLSGIDMTGETRGQLHTPEQSYWTLPDMGANAFGQAINVTPIQLAVAVGSVANGGNLMRPYIVQAIERNGVITETRPTVRARVFHDEVCGDVTDMLVEIGEIKGEGGGPIAPGYRVALKTGTSEIPLPGGGGYDPHRSIASAIGYAPAEDPEFLILVRIEGNDSVWGERTAVPVLRELTQFMLNYLRVPPSTIGSDGEP